MNDENFFYDDTDSESSDEEELGIKHVTSDKVRTVVPSQTLLSNHAAQSNSLRQLFEVTLQGDIQQISVLLKSGVNVNSQDKVWYICF